MSQSPKTLGELCEITGLELSGRDPQLKVERLIQPVSVSVGTFKADLKNKGFKRLERRDTGVYEDVTAPKGERIVGPP